MLRATFLGLAASAHWPEPRQAEAQEAAGMRALYATPPARGQHPPHPGTVRRPCRAYRPRPSLEVTVAPLRPAISTGIYTGVMNNP